MGSSSKKKKEKKKDFQKAKLKVGKARPKNTNATDTTFSSKSIVFKQQNLTENARDGAALFNHNLSLLSSKTETQRRDALSYLTTICSTERKENLPQPPSIVVSKAQPLILDGNSQVRQQLLKLLRSLPLDQLGPLDQLLLYARAGMAHLSTDIRISSLQVLDWALEINGEAIVSCFGGWVKTLRTFQDLLSWHSNLNGSVSATNTNNRWSSTKPTTNLGSNKLFVHQLSTLSRFLTAGLTRPSLEKERAISAKQAEDLFPLWHTNAHLFPKKSNPFGYLNLFSMRRDVESEMYEDAEERAELFMELGLFDSFAHGVREAKKEAGEVGRAAAMVEKALRLVDGA